MDGWVASDLIPLFPSSLSLTLSSLAASLLDLTKYDEEIAKLRHLADRGRLLGEEVYRGAHLPEAERKSPSPLPPAEGLLHGNLSSLDLQEVYQRLRKRKALRRKGRTEKDESGKPESGVIGEEIVLTPAEREEARKQLRKLRIQQFMSVVCFFSLSCHVSLLLSSHR